MTSLLYLLPLFVSASSQEFTTPSILLGPRDYNHHPYEGQYLKEINPPEPTKKGPVLFPNDAPPPPKPPLIVTARPLAESIARSELNPETNETRTNENDEQTQENHIEQPGFSDRSDYSFVTQRPVFVNPVTGSPVYDYDYGYEFKHPYEGVLKKSRVLNKGADHRFDDYEEQTVLPPIYKALSDHANQKVLKIQQSKKQRGYKVKEPDHFNPYTDNYLDKDGEDQSEDEQNSNYAFSYTVRDKDTGDDFSHTQKSSGSATNGEYRVRLPDGRMQIVSYTADENGYKADVRYDDVDNRIENHSHNSRYKEQNQRKHEETKINQHYPLVNQYDRRLNELNQRARKPSYLTNYPISKTQDYRQRIVEEDPRLVHGPQIHEPVARAREYRPNVPEYRPKISDNGPLAEYKARINEQNLRIAEYNQRIDNHNQRNGIQSQHFDDQNVITNQDNNYVNYKADDENYNNIYKINDDYSFDTLKDYGDDYSAEFDGKQYEYQPHQSKFNHLVQNSEQNKNIGVIVVPNVDKSTVRPSLQSLRNLFLNKTPINSKIPVELRVPSTTQNPNYFDSDENVVVIGTPKPNLYTNTQTSVVPTTEQPFSYQTPSSYLETTIASLKNRNVDYSGSKPVLTGSFIDRINKYLTF